MGTRLKTHRWDAADTLQSQADIDAYLEAAQEEHDPELLRVVLEDIARAQAKLRR